MQKHFFSLLLPAVILVLSACNQNKTSEAALSSADSLAAETPQILVSDGDTSFTVVPATDVPAGAAVTGGEGLNPPHGQPGHRCDIPEGAPLNSPAGTPQLPNTPPPPTTAAPATPAAPTPAGMNPPHGEPGHDCAVPVGSPLPKK